MLHSDFSSISNQNPSSCFEKASETTSEASNSPTFFQRITKVVHDKCFDILLKERYSHCDKSYVKALKFTLNEKKNIVELQKGNHKTSVEVGEAL